MINPQVFLQPKHLEMLMVIISCLQKVVLGKCDARAPLMFRLSDSVPGLSLSFAEKGALGNGMLGDHSAS